MNDSQNNDFELEYQLNPYEIIADIIAHGYIKTSLEISDYQLDKTILDIGGGSKSILLSTIGFKSGTIIDPVNYPLHINGFSELLTSKKITFRNNSIEDLLDEYDNYDEVWCYNVLPHTNTPEKFLISLLQKVKDNGIVRIMEPMHDPYEHHPTKVTSELLDVVRKNSSEIIKDIVVNFNGEGQFINDQIVLIAKIKKPSKSKLKIHIYGLPHTLTVRDDPRMMTCAYTTKIWLLCKKLIEEGHEVIHYGVEGSKVPCTENIEYIPFELWNKYYGNKDPKELFSVDPQSELYRYAATHLPNEINKRIKDPHNEIVLASFGYWAEELKQINKAALIEFGVGYEGIFSNYRAFESYAWQHTVYGLRKEHIDFKGWYDAIIPGYVDPDEFEFNDNPKDYLLFIGRMIDTKGIFVAAQLADHFKVKLKIAGNGDTSWMTTDQYKDIIEYVGVIGIKEKRELLKNAKATLCLTHYVEPFANVHMESLMSGTPVISTDWGVFTETLPYGEVGFHVRTWEDYLYAYQNIDKINRRKCREWAMSNWSLDAVYPKFESYFKKCVEHFNSKDSWYFKQTNYSQNFISNYRQSFMDYTMIHIMMVLNDKFIDKSILAFNSFSNFHEQYDITIIDCGLDNKNKQRLQKIKGFKQFIKSNDQYSIYFAKPIYMNQIANSGKLLVMDADILLRDNIKEFFFFENNTFINAVDDFATPEQQYNFNKQLNENNETYYQKEYFEYFPNLKEYKDNMTYNCGFFCIDLNNSKSKKFLNELSDISKQLAIKTIHWPYDQGVFNYLIFKNELKVKNFGFEYNNSAYQNEAIENKNVKVVHYHTDEILNKYLQSE